MQDMSFFYLLKDQLLVKYQEVYPYWQQSIHDFKGREISNFQELLEKQVGSRISEKWFYTHIKPKKNSRLPRIDTLDMLSAYVGYDNWEDFVYQEKIKRSPSSEKKEVKTTTTPIISRKMIFAPLFILAFFMSLAAMLGAGKNDYTFCFVDMDRGKAIEGPIEIFLLSGDESPELRQTDKKACISFKQKKGTLTFIVKAPYYQSDTIVKILPKNKDKEIIKLKTDDYALMIHLFSTSNLKDWQKRRDQLDKMFKDDAVIFQVSESARGVAMYNKEEFIDKLTIPINSLKNIRILETKYDKDKIEELRFIQD